MASGLPRNMHKIRELAGKQAATITLGQLMRSRTRDPQGMIHLGRWLHEHLPIRFARRLDEFLLLPYVVVQNPQFNEVYHMYLDSLDAVCSFPEITTPDQEADFCKLVGAQVGIHGRVAGLVAEGYFDVRRMHPQIRLDGFLDNLFTTRISSRILVENYIDMRDPVPKHPGVVQRDLMPIDTIEKLASALEDLTHSIYGVSPQVQFQGNLQCTLDYIPGHVHIVVKEVLKNALRATVERHIGRMGSSAEGDVALPPPVVVELQKGDLNVIIKVSDQGGGMPKHLQKEAWQYGWTSVKDDGEPAVVGSKGNKKDLAGYGFGLPLTRLFASYFGGDVFMQALPGHGTDVYLLLNHLREGLPSTEMDDSSTALTVNENLGNSMNEP